MNPFEIEHVKPLAGRTLVVGSKLHGPHRDYRKNFPEAVGIDIEAGEGVDFVHDLEQPLNMGRFAHVVCHSVMEHVQRPWLMAENIENLLEDSGTIYLSVPWAWRFHSYPNDYWRISHEGLKVIFPRIEWKQYLYELSDGGPYPKKLKKGLTHGNIKYLPRSMLHAFGVKRAVSESKTLPSSGDGQSIKQGATS